MAPPPATAHTLRQRPITLELLTAQLSVEDARINVARLRQERIATLNEDIRQLSVETQSTIQEAMDAIADGFPDTATLLLRQASRKQDLLQTTAAEADRLREKQAEDEADRAKEVQIRRAQLHAARREKPWRPDGPGAA